MESSPEDPRVVMSVITGAPPPALADVVFAVVPLTPVLVRREVRQLVGVALVSSPPASLPWPTDRRRHGCTEAPWAEQVQLLGWPSGRGLAWARVKMNFSLRFILFQN